MLCGRQVTLGIYTLVEGNTLTASTAFPALTLLDTLRQPLQEFPRMLTMVLVEGRVSLERLNAFMNEADIVEYVKRGPAVVADARCIDIRGAARARPRCTTAYPLHTRFANMFGASVSEATMRTEPRRHLPLGARKQGVGSQGCC